MELIVAKVFDIMELIVAKVFDTLMRPFSEWTRYQVVSKVPGMLELN